MKTKLLIIFSLVKGLLCSQTSVGTFAGRLIDLRDKTAIPFAMISIDQGKIHNTDVNGNFEIDSISSGHHQARFVYPFYADTSISFKINSQQRIDSNISIRKICFRSSSNSTCPKCSKKDLVIPIVYGDVKLPKSQATREKYLENHMLGGCIIQGDNCDARWYCRRDSLRF